MTHSLRIATRNSRLALWQAEFVARALAERHAGLPTQLAPMKTQGDSLHGKPPPGGGKGLFTKELERALLDGAADIAVHSMKDLPTTLPAGLTVAAILERANPADAMVSEHYTSLADLPEGAAVGTASLRRACQIQHCYRQVRIKPLRGNVNTRLAKLKSGDYDAIILACAGLMRLGYADAIREELSPDVCLPAIGQGAIGIECRGDDEATQTLLAPLHHKPTADCVKAERAVNQHLGGDCQAPIAAHAQIAAGHITVRALVGSPDGSRLLTSEAQGASEQAQQVGIRAAEQLREAGADDLLAEYLGR